MIRKESFALFLAIVLLARCDSSAVVDDRTLPSALDLPVITLAAAVSATTAPGSYNVEAFVTTRAICELPSSCGESYILVSDIKGAGPFSTGAVQAVFPTQTPTQFRKDSKYLFSIQITVEDPGLRRKYSLLGYDDI